MKKLLLTILFSILAFKVFAAAPDVSIGSAVAFPSQTFSVPVTADFSIPVGSSSFTIKYDPAILTLTSITTGSSNSSWLIVSNPTSGSVNVGMFSATGIDISGTAQQIAVANFTVNTSPGTATLVSPNIDISNVVFDNNSIPTVTNGNFTLGLLGDVNGDGKVTIADATLIAQSVVGLTALTTIQTLAAEVDHSSKVNIYDCLLIAQYSTNIINKF